MQACSIDLSGGQGQQRNMLGRSRSISMQGCLPVIVMLHSHSDTGFQSTPHISSWHMEREVVLAAEAATEIFIVLAIHHHNIHNALEVHSH